MSCSTRMMALTPARLGGADQRLASAPCFSAVETPEVGSSSRITSGFSAKADATSSSFFSPCESRRDTRCPAGAHSPKMRAISATRGTDGCIVRIAAENSRHCLCLLRDHGSSDGLRHGQLWENLHELERARHAALGQHDRADTADVLRP